MAREKARQEAIDRANKDAKGRFLQAVHAGDIGTTIWWSLKHGYKADAALVVDEWKKAGRDPDADLPPAPDVNKAFTRAVRGAAVFAGTFSCNLENLEDDANGVRRVSVFHMHKNGSATGTEIGKVGLPPQGRPYVEIADPHGIAQRIVDTTDPRVGLYTGEDLRSALTRVISRNYGSPCREDGVVYWIHGAAVGEIEKVKVALEAIAAGTIGGLTGKAGVDDATKAANQGVGDMIGLLVKDVNDWRLKPPAKFSTVEERMGQLQELKGRADLLRTMLGSGVHTIDKQLSTLSQEFLSIMGMVNQNTAAAS